jgi:glucose-1-phosphate adenylyltransferase
MLDVLSIILGGGRGTRLYPLTKKRAKPAVPLAGKYRLIDIPVSNCINSQLEKIYVLTQFNSASLNRHIVNTYRFSPFAGGFVDVLAAQQTPENPDWFQGTADAVRQYLWLFESWKEINDYLILSGDHLYRMDYRPFIEHHRQTGADVTLSVIPCNESIASSFGLIKIDDSGRVISFSEKPKGDPLKAMQVDTQSLGLEAAAAAEMPYIASMGIYVFTRKALVDLLSNRQHTDFGKEVIPAAIDTYNIQAYLFKGYWEDIGTVEAFYRANLALVKQPAPPFSFYDQDFPIYTRPRFLPPNKILDSTIADTMIADGCIIKNSQIRNSVIGVRTRLEANTVIENTLVMGADYYESSEVREQLLAQGTPPVGIGANSQIANAIVDKNARIGRNVKILNKDHVEEAEREEEGIWISNGIVIVVKDATIADNTII